MLKSSSRTSTKTGVAPGMPHGVGGGDEGMAGGDDLVASTDPGRDQREVQGYGAVGDRDAVAGAAISGELALETGDFPAPA